MSEANKALARRWFEEVWNKGREDAIDEMLHAEGLAWGLPDPGSALKGPENFKPFHRQFQGAFPGIEVTVEDTIAEDDRVAVRWTARMTHRGDHLGFAATGKDAVVTGMSFLRIRDGKIMEGWNNWDVRGLMQQLGAERL